LKKNVSNKTNGQMLILAAVIMPNGKEEEAAKLLRLG
jgi:hypothetical protein